MDITRSELDTTVGPPQWFAGNVCIDVVGTPIPESKILGGLIRFAPGARTAWHSHPLGQTVFITEGVGLVQREGGPIEEVRPGDRVVFAPGENHWHGASPTRFTAQIAYQEADENGEHTTWGRHLTDPEYAAATRPSTAS